MSRRRFLGYLIAAPTLVAAAEMSTTPAAAAIPTVQPVDAFDALDAAVLVAAPTADLIEVVVDRDGTVSFDLHRTELGQGISTGIAMTIADELGVPLDRVSITLADARPELMFNQFTAGSNTMHVLFTPVRVAAAIARERLVQVSADLLEVSTAFLTVSDGVIRAPDGRSLSFGDLAERAAASETTIVRAQLKPQSELRMIGTPQRRIDARDIVAGQKRFAMDLDVPGALPTMICRAPTIGGTPRGVRNLTDVQAMPGVTDVTIVPRTGLVPGGVAVRAQTFGQCIDAVRALDVAWGPGTVDSKTEAAILADLRRAELPLPPLVNLLAQSVQHEFIFHFRPGEPLEPNCAIADVRSDRADIWSSIHNPIWLKEQIALQFALPLDRVGVHVTPAGGSFGRGLFPDAAFEAATISKLIGKPVKLMWHRTDGFRHGRVHPMCISRIRVCYLGNNVLTFDQRHTGVATDFTHGMGELLTAMAAKTLPDTNAAFAQFFFALAANVPYNFGLATQLNSEIYAHDTFNTGSVRNSYSPDVATATELVVDQVARRMRMDPYAFRRAFVRDARLRAVLDKAASLGRWGRAMAPGTAQGLSIHWEYKSRGACLVEIDCTPATVNRNVIDGYGGPRVTKVVFVVDVGLPINPLGIEAQMMGGIMDGIAQALSYSLHLRDGSFLEASWDNAYYTRQWNAPIDTQIVVMPQTTDEVGGVGEFAVGTAMAAVSCAYARATGTLPTRFPINHDMPLGFTPLPSTPSIPQSPTNGLER